MKATNFLLDAPALAGVSAARKSATFAPAAKREAANPRPLNLLQRLDRWLWQQQVREREAYLARSKDIFELERRMRSLERLVGGRYY